MTLSHPAHETKHISRPCGPIGLGFDRFLASLETFQNLDFSNLVEFVEIYYGVTFFAITFLEPGSANKCTVHVTLHQPAD